MTKKTNILLLLKNSKWPTIKQTYDRHCRLTSKVLLTRVSSTVCYSCYLFAGRAHNMHLNISSLITLAKELFFAYHRGKTVNCSAAGQSEEYKVNN